MQRLEIKLATDQVSLKGEFAGYGAVFGNKDAYGDAIAEGAFKRTLKEWKSLGKYPPMLLQHGGGIFGGGADDKTPIGVWDHMEENSKGLKVEGRLIALGTDRAQYILEGLKEGALDGLSIGFRTRKSEVNANPKPNEPSRVLTDIELVELSIVTFPANPKARVTAVKDMRDLLTVDFIREYEAALRDARFSQRQAVTVVSCLKNLLRDEGASLPTVSDRDDHDPAQTATIADLIKTARRVRAGMIGAR